MSRPSHPTRAAGFAPMFVSSVLEDALRHHSRIYAIAGVQGSGKSTLAAQVTALAKLRGLRALSLSIDDFYFGRRQRQRLARSVHPLLAERGPPGTHDIALACETLDALREGRPVRVPRYDKLTDRPWSPSKWPRVQNVDLILFEGWCLKVPAQPAPALRRHLNALERNEDTDCAWRRYCNAALEHDYPKLWQRLDRLLFLRAPSFAVVADWRWQQEVAARAQRARSLHGMSRAQIERFVQLFERISRHALRTLPNCADWTVRLDNQRRPTTSSASRVTESDRNRPSVRAIQRKLIQR